jgi:hypothetical protein
MLLVPPATDACSDLARAEGLALAGSATQARRWLLLEVPGRWGRDVATDNDLPPESAERLIDWQEASAARVLFIRRPGRRGQGLLAFVAETTEDGGALRRVELGRPEELVGLDLERAGERIDGPLLLVCAHGRRDACCTRRGIPVFDALTPVVPPDRLWQSSHHGGHRFAANVLILPAGVQLGRVEPTDAPEVAAVALDGRIPLDHYRGRTLHPPAAQAADAAVRTARGLDRIGDVTLADVRGDVVRLRVPGAVVEVEVSWREGPPLPPSCGVEPEPTSIPSATLGRENPDLR